MAIVNKLPIQAKSMQTPKSPCFTCPFAGEEPIPLTPERLKQILKDVVNFNSSHLCHTSHNRKLCRGARDIQIKIAYLRGWISESTDAAFQAELMKTGAVSNGDV